MNKRNILILFIFIGFICSISAVSAHEGMPNPVVEIDNYEPNQNISGNVEFEFKIVHQDAELEHINVTAEHLETRTKYLDQQDSNPNDGWSIKWDTSNAPNGEYWITTTARDVNGLEGKTELKLVLNNLPTESSIVLDNVTTVVNKQTNIVATLKDINSTPLAGKAVDFIIDGNTYHATTTNEGVATVPFTPKKVKNYEMLVKFEGDNKYIGCQENAVIKVMSNLTAPSVTVNNVRGNNKERIQLKANLLCPGLYTESMNKKIDFYVNNQFAGYNYTDENGNAMIYYNISEAGGTYLFQARYQNESGENFTDTAFLYVPQSELYITMSAVTYSKDSILTVGNAFKLKYVVNNNGPDSAENTVVTYQVPASLKYVESAPSKGKVTLNSNNLIWNIGEVPVGSQILEITFQILSAGRINLSPSISTVTYDDSAVNAIPDKFLTVNSYRLTSKNLIKYYGGSSKYKVYLYTNDGKPVSGANIKISINKQSVNLKTNSKGFVELAINLKAGTYSIKSTCNSLSVSNKVIIKPTLITKNISVKKSKKTKFTVKLLDTNGKALKSKKIVFKLKGKKYTAKTNKKGIATVVLKNLKVGKYTIQTKYGKMSVKNTIRIKK